MIYVVLCKVSQPSREEPKSYDGKFVTAKCSSINYGATLMYHAPALSSQGSPFAKINSQARKFGTESFWGSIFGPGVSVWFFSKPWGF